MDARSQLLRTVDAAKYLNVSRSFLDIDRLRPDGPTIPFVRLGERAIRYVVSDLEEIIESRRRHKK